SASSSRFLTSFASISHIASATAQASFPRIESRSAAKRDSSLGRAATMVSLCNKIDKRNRRAHGKPGMPGFQPSMLTIATVSGAVKAAQLRQILRERRKVAQDQSDLLSTFRFIGNAFWY